MAAPDVGSLRERGHLLGEIRFEAARGEAESERVQWPRAYVATPPLGGPAPVEVWLSDEPVHYGREGRLMYAQNREVLFGCLTCAEPELEPFEARVRESYSEIFAALQSTGFPHLVRIWNYFPDIHARAGALDRYQTFCQGRFDAISPLLPELERQVPAATAIGTRGGGLVIYFIAAREPAVHHDNPRQLPAYRYPPEHGPRSPSFARASAKRWGGENWLYISGTASIVGHESRHRDAPGEQLEEAMRNVRALLRGPADAEAPLRAGDFASLYAAKVYVRNVEDYARLKARLDVLLPGIETLYLQGEICRRELLMEIEAIARLAG